MPHSVTFLGFIIVLFSLHASQLIVQASVSSDWHKRHTSYQTLIAILFHVGVNKSLKMFAFPGLQKKIATFSFLHNIYNSFFEIGKNDGKATNVGSKIPLIGEITLFAERTILFAA